MIRFKFKREENDLGKGENAGYQHFLLFLTCFQKPSFSGSLKVWLVWIYLKTLMFSKEFKYDSGWN